MRQMDKTMSFSVLISVYKNDKAEDFHTALESITTRQTIKPKEIVLVVDGPVPDDINIVISEAEDSFPGLFTVLRFERNMGLGIALQKGMEVATNEIVMRMDSDDIAAPDRFEKQYHFMIEHTNVAVCGGQIAEFIDDVKNVVGSRIVPCSNEDIYKYMKFRCPFNHMTVALRRSIVMDVGNYQPWFWNEDYYLWLRMILAKCEFANLPETLVYVRVGKDMYKRRGGKKYFRSEKDLQKFMLENGLISHFRYNYNVFGRWCVQMAMPSWLRGYVFQHLFRK